MSNAESETSSWIPDDLSWLTQFFVPLSGFPYAERQRQAIHSKSMGKCSSFLPKMGHILVCPFTTFFTFWMAENMISILQLINLCDRAIVWLRTLNTQWWTNNFLYYSIHLIDRKQYSFASQPTVYIYAAEQTNILQGNSKYRDRPNNSSNKTFETGLWISTNSHMLKSSPENCFVFWWEVINQWGGKKSASGVFSCLMSLCEQRWTQKGIL